MENRLGMSSAPVHILFFGFLCQRRADQKRVAHQRGAQASLTSLLLLLKLERHKQLSSANNVFPV